MRQRRRSGARDGSSAPRSQEERGVRASSAPKKGAKGARAVELLGEEGAPSLPKREVRGAEAEEIVGGEKGPPSLERKAKSAGPEELEDGPDAPSRSPATPRPKEIPPRLARVLSAVPVRREGGALRWEVGPDGLVVITHPKDLTRFERWLMKKVGGSPEIRRRLDRPGSDIWLLCDGRHTVAEICDEMDRKYREELEPVLTRVTKFLEMLLARNLICLRREKRGGEGGEGRAQAHTAAGGGEAAGAAEKGTADKGRDGAVGERGSGGIGGG